MSPRFKKFIVALSLSVMFIWLPRKTGLGCGPQLSQDETRFNLFRLGAESAALEPFYYTEYFLNEQGGEDLTDKDRERNVEEWHTFAGTEIPEADVYNLLYATEPDAFLNGYNKGAWDSLEANRFVQWLRQPAHRDALDYMALAKQSEWIQTGNTDPWDEGTLVTAADRKSLAVEAEQRGEAEPSAFLKARYGFQAMRAWHYAGSRDSTLTDTARQHVNRIYTKIFAPSARNRHPGKQSVLEGWAVWFYGLAQTDTMARTRAFVKAFALSDEKKVIAFQQVSERNLARFLQTKNVPFLREAALVMQGTQRIDRALPNIKALAAVNPKSRYLPLLIGREVAKIEDWILSPQVLGFESNLRYWPSSSWDSYDKYPYDTTDRYYAHLNRRKDGEYASAVRSYLESLAPHSGVNRAYLLLAVAHLYIVERRFADARRVLHQISPKERSNKALRIQWAIDGAVAEMNLEDVRQPQTQRKLLHFLEGLEKDGLKPVGALRNNVEEWAYSDERSDDLSELLLLLSRRFYEAGDVVRAGLLWNKASVQTAAYASTKWYGDEDSSLHYHDIAFYDCHGTVADVDAVIAFRNAQNHTPFDTYLLPHRWPQEDYYRDLKATMLLRQSRYPEALAVFETMPDSFWVKEDGYRYNLPRTSLKIPSHWLPGSDTQKIHPYESKKALLREIIALQAELARPATAQERNRQLLQWGHVQYNLTYWGKGWMLFSYGRSDRELEERGSDPYEWAYFGGGGSRRYGSAYYDLQAATAAYQRAFRRSEKTDKEAAAVALLMLNRCYVEAPLKPERHLPTGIYRNRWYNYGAQKPLPPSPYLQRLRSHYQETAFIKALVASCPDAI